jgi:cyclopropane fatty-acyl-phospholipid synthase-like methyltransferase
MNFSQLMSLASGHVEARIVQTAVELGIFAALEASPSSAAAIATSRKLNPQATELLLNALTSLQLLNKHSETFSLTDISKRFLLLSSANYVGDMIRFESSLWHCWEKLPEAICSGKPARSANMYQDDSNETAIFINAMDSLVKARGDAEIIANTLNWDEVGELLDVGSGPATYPIALCQKFGHLHATIFDLPATLNLTRRFVRQAGIEDRVHLIAGDYRKDTIPGNYDVIFLSNIIHGEGYAKNESLIRKLTNNLKLSGRMVIKDHILDDSRANPAVGAIFSLLMLLTTDGGRCYSFSEIESWMKQSGLSRVEQINLPSPLTSSLVIGAK